MDKDIEDFDREDFDPNEWGNIPLPGLTDEELHSKNWHMSDITRERNKKQYGYGEYIVRSPGNDLLDFYDKEMLKLDPTSKAFSLIPPSIVYHYRFKHKYPIELFDKSKNYGRFAYLRDQLKDYYQTSDTTYWSQIYKTRFRWLLDTPHKEFKFKYRNEVEEFFKERFKQKAFRLVNLTKSKDETKILSHCFWRGVAAGWSITWKNQIDQ